MQWQAATGREMFRQSLRSASREARSLILRCQAVLSLAPLYQRQLGDGRSAHRTPRRALVQEEASVLYILHREASGWAMSAADALCHQ